MKRIVALLVLTCFSFPLFLRAEDACIPKPPSPFKLVNNFSKEFPDFLSGSEENDLETKLQAFNKETSNQIVIVIVDDLCGYDANEFSTRLGQQWGVGQGKFDNGIVVLVKPTGGEGQRDVYIAVGYGLEGIIPDVVAHRIVDREIIPQFRNGNSYAGLDAATTVLIQLAQKEYSYKDYGKGPENWMPFIVAVLILIVLGIILSRRKGYTISSRGRRYYGGGWSSWGGGGWGRGGGGFGGGSFGGGGFGGGGSGGKW